MELHKLAANKPGVLRAYPDTLKAKTVPLEAEAGDWAGAPSMKTLGVVWIPQQDVFTFVELHPLPPQLTKRAALSTVMRIYDPLGWILPIVMGGRLLFQQVTRVCREWDSLVPPDITQAFHKWH